MSISDQDREWVRAIVQEAAAQAISLSRNQLYVAIKEHGETCSLKWRGQGKAFLAGIIAASLLAGTGLAAIAHKLLDLR